MNTQGFMKLVWAVLFGGLALCVSPVVAAQQPTHNCTAGCTIITCSGSTCTIWDCNGSGGCTAVGTFPNTHPKPATDVAGSDDVTIVFTCSGSSCTVWNCSGASGCTSVGAFQGPLPKSATNVAGSDDVTTVTNFLPALGADGSVIVQHHPIPSVAFAKVCESEHARKCALYELGTGPEAAYLGSFDNVDAVIAERKQALADSKAD
jgi:hypothetical protein